MPSGAVPAQLPGLALAGAELVAGLAVRPGERIVIKRRFSAFFDTELDRVCRRMGVGRVVICGVQASAESRGATGLGARVAGLGADAVFPGSSPRTLLNRPRAPLSRATARCSPQTPNCIRGTAWDAIALDYPQVTVLSDATASSTDEVQQANLYDLRAVSVDTPTVAEWAAQLGDVHD